ncbi:MAG: N(4)-(beta-N-acetylglucosaminyl)-L-asparaginase [Aphanocapsa lilacina HA4352-LM1]|nr:N(4)-(beta-N-acetylglucosaminyl)-L-asparaginase [Aphanocapsa lilacina HA4352-LM1]
MKRRAVVLGGALASGLGAFPALAQAVGRPVVVASANGLAATETAIARLKAGADTLDAVVAGVNLVEDDPEDMTVGYGGLPNEEGEVELDASVMHGPTSRAGAVASLKQIKNPSKVAKLVMERTDHVLLVGEGALRFAVAHGFAKQDLLTEKARTVWLRWKETMSDKDDWGPGLADPGEAAQAAMADWIIADRLTGTINCLAVDGRGDISGVTTTSGLAFKIPGRVGDSPLIGCGLFVDNAVGAAGSTGRGEECIKINGAHTIVEGMRRGLSPTDACLEALKRVAAHYSGDRRKLAQFNLHFYALAKSGAHGAASLWGTYGSKPKRSRYAVSDGDGSRLLDSAYLFEVPGR